MSESKVTLKFLVNFSGTLFSDFSSYNDSFVSYHDCNYSIIEEPPKQGGKGEREVGG